MSMVIYLTVIYLTKSWGQVRQTSVLVSVQTGQNDCIQNFIKGLERLKISHLCSSVTRIFSKTTFRFS
jgi:hypothetical protein